MSRGAWAAFVIVLALGVATAARSVQGGDVGELVLVATNGGVAHPPGYPVWISLARVFAFLPIGSAVFRAALLSCVAMAACAAVMQRISAKLTGSESAALAAAIAFGVSPLAWRLAGVPEVFALAALAASLVLLVAMRYAEMPSGRHAALLGVAFGIALAVHQTTVFLAPIVGGVLLTRRAKLPSFAAGLALGLASFLLLPVHARLAGADGWVWGEMSGARGLIRHVLRSDYGTFSLAIGSDAPRPLAQASVFLFGLPRELSGVYLVAAVAGLRIAWQRSRASTLALAASIVLSGVAFPALFNLPASQIGREVAARFHLLPLVLVIPFVAFGLAAAEKWTRLGRILTFAPLPIAAAFTYADVNWRSDRFVERWTHAVLSPLAPDAVLLGQGDLETFAFLWTTRGERVRSDVRYVDIHLLRYEWYFEDVKRHVPQIASEFDASRTRLVPLIDSLHAAGIAVHATPEVAPLLGDYSVEPEGLVARIWPPGRPPTDPAALEAKLQSATQALGKLGPPVDAWSAHARATAAVPWIALAAEYEKRGDHDSFDRCRRRALALAPPL